MPSEFVGPFLGVKPRVSPELLDNGFGQVALNCLIESGILESSKAPLATGTTLQSGTKTIHWFNRDANSGNGYWFQFSNVVNVIRGQISGDTSLRTYIFGDGAPKYTISSIATGGGGPYPSVVRTLGLPSPSKPLAAGASGSPPTGTTKISVAYVVTYVSDIGEEGPPSYASNVVDRWDGESVTLSGISVASGSFVVAEKRIYRAELNGVFQYVDSVAASEFEFVDSVPSERLGEPVPSDGWVSPSASIVGAVSLPNGGIMSWWGNTVAFCEPYYPHAWPIQYRLALDFDVVGAAVSASGIIVCTTGAPYLISGTTPSGMSQNKIDTVAACISAQSIVDMGDYILYACSDGLIAAGGMKAENVTQEFMRPEQWRSLISPKTLKGYRYKDYYIGFYSGGSFAFRPGVGFLFYSDTADCGFVDDREGVLYIKQGTALKKWNEGAPNSFTWRSRLIRIPSGSTFASAKVDAKNYPVTFKYYADGVLQKNISVTNKKSFRLPNRARYTNAEFEISGTNSVVSVQLATAASEIV